MNPVIQRHFFPALRRGSFDNGLCPAPHGMQGSFAGSDLQIDAIPCFRPHFIDRLFEPGVTWVSDRGICCGSTLLI